MDYQEILKDETLRIYREWIPYAKGSPEEEVTYDDQYDRANFIFVSDSHIDHRNTEESLKNVEDMVSFINHSPLCFDGVIHGGDIITPFWKVDKEIAINRAKSFFQIAHFSKVPFLFAKGNHDLNDWGNLPENILTDEDWSQLFLDQQEKRFGIVRQKKQSGQKSTWHYYDVEAHKIRVIVLDMQDTDKKSLTEEGTVKFHGGESAYLSNEQMNWIAHTALDFDDKAEKNWGVIFCFHQCSERKEYHEPIIDKLLSLMKAFQNQTQYHCEYIHPQYSFFDLKISADFTRYKEWEQKPHIICCLVGHDHEDKQEVREGIHFLYCLNQSATTVSSDARVARVPGTVTQNSFDILNIDTRHKKIRMFRFGAGVNCYGVGGNRFLPEGLTY